VTRAPNTATPAGRAAGAQHAKAMLLAIRAKDEAIGVASKHAKVAFGADVEQLVGEHIEAALKAAAGFRGGFYATLGGWLAPTVQGCAISGDLVDWEPLAEEAGAADGPAPAPRPAPAEWAPDAERLRIARRATYQAEELLDLILRELGRSEGMEEFALRGLAIRLRQLVHAIMSVTDESDETPTDDLYRAVEGVHRAAEGAAS